jgi:hypothetical protein
MVTRSRYGTAHCATFADGLGAGGRKFALPRRWGLTINPLPQFLARLEVRDELLLHLYCLPGHRIAASTRRSVVDLKAAEAADLDAPAFHQAHDHGFEDRRDRKLGYRAALMWLTAERKKPRLRRAFEGFRKAYLLLEPTTSISTRRSGCRHLMTFALFRPLHWSG